MKACCRACRSWQSLNESNIVLGTPSPNMAVIGVVIRGCHVVSLHGGWVRLAHLMAVSCLHGFMHRCCLSCCGLESGQALPDKAVIAALHLLQLRLRSRSCPRSVHQNSGHRGHGQLLVVCCPLQVSDWVNQLSSMHFALIEGLCHQPSLHAPHGFQLHVCLVIQCLPKHRLRQI